MAHVPLQDHPRGLVSRLAARYTKHRFGQMVEPTAAASHHAGVLVAMGSLETAAQFGWRKLDPTLRWLALQATAARIGCSWCIDYGSYEGLHGGVDPAKVRAVGTWRASDLFDERERWCSSTPRWRLAAPPRSPTSWPPESGFTSATPSSSSSLPGWRWRTSGPASMPGSVFAARASRTTATAPCRLSAADAVT